MSDVIVIVEGGKVVSGDGDLHVLSPSDVARCYRLRPSSKVRLVYRDDDRFYSRGYNPNDIIYLYPRAGGDYESHLKEALKERGASLSDLIN